jgi:alpha-mannosidase
MPDDFLNSQIGEIVFKVLYKTGIVRNLLDIIFPFYGKVNKFDPKEFRFYAMGQSHLDTAWNWTWWWSQQKIRVTFGNALQHMKEFPRFKFSASAPVHYEYFEKAYPSLFSELKNHVKNNRWDIVGGMYVESDGNVPDGESITRQCLYGQKYFITRFGKHASVAWLPDSFGFTWSYPQILAKSGLNYFFTTKITWNLEHEFPFSVFWWQGPDGTRVLSTNIRNGFRGLEKVGEMKTKARLLPDGLESPIYNYRFDFTKDSRSNDFIRDFAHVYGLGDGGGGPLFAEILIPETCRKIKGWQFVQGGVYFKLLEKLYGPRIPVWADELFLEVHHGCQTTFYSAKKQNRNCEVLLPKMEKFAILSSVLSERNEEHNNKLSSTDIIWTSYNVSIFDDCWKKMLFNQFHDILPGSSIQEVYIEAHRDYTIIQKSMDDCRKQILSSIGCNESAISTKDQSIAFYPYHWAGNTVFYENLESNDRNERLKLHILEKKKGIGFGLINLNDKLKGNDHSKNICNVTRRDEKQINIETPLLHATLDPVTASISSLQIASDNFQFNFATDIKKENQTFHSGLNKLRLFKDEPDSNDAWNLDPHYRDYEIQNTHVHDYRVVQPDDSCQSLEIQFDMHINDSDCCMSYVFHPELPYIIINLKMNYQEHRKLLRIEFDSAIESEKVTNAIAYGIIDHSTDPIQPLDEGRWEFPGQKYISISDDIHGISVMCDNRYGFHCKKNQFGMSLLRGPLYGDPDGFMYPATEEKKQSILQRGGTIAIEKDKREIYKDLGNHVIKWAIYPHAGDWRDAKVYQEFHNFTDSPIVFRNTPETQTTSNIFKENYCSLIDCSLENVHISTIKPIYGQNSGLIIRLFEFLGKDCKGQILFNKDLHQLDPNLYDIYNADLLETKIHVREDPDFFVNETDNLVNFSIKPFEIKTIVIKKKDGK